MFTCPNNHNRTALHIACKEGNLMIAYILIEAGIDPNQVDNKMKSPMRMAAKNGHSDVVQYLINVNGSPEIKVTQIYYNLINIIKIKNHIFLSKFFISCYLILF